MRSSQGSVVLFQASDAVLTPLALRELPGCHLDVHTACPGLGFLLRLLRNGLTFRARRALPHVGVDRAVVRVNTTGPAPLSLTLRPRECGVLRVPGPVQEIMQGQAGGAAVSHPGCELRVPP